MKLVIILSIEECHEELRSIYRDHGVRIFSEMDIRGYPLSPKDGSAPFGWFSDADPAVYSTAGFAFLETGKADELMNALSDYTCEGEPGHPIHAFMMPVDRAVSSGTE